MASNVSGVAGERLLSFIERVERLEEEKRAIAEDIKEVYAEAKGVGFDTKTMRKIVALRRLSEEERAEEEALLDVYKAALGMLSDTPLGSAAIERITRKKPKPEAEAEPETTPAAPPPKPNTDWEAPEGAPPAEKPIWFDDTIDAARVRGRAASQNGEAVTTNPYPARDPRRAAWDEEWCKHSGSDGMEVPEFLRRTPKKKPDDKAV